MGTNQRVCVIGAGPCGVAALCQWAQLKVEGREVPEVVCYEKQKSVGGMWNFTWRIGTDENGEPAHSSIYRHMLTNSPKECMEQPDYTFDQHFGRATPSYVYGDMIKDYIQGRLVSKPGNLMQYIQFNTAVKLVSYDDATDQFTVTVRNYDDDTLTSSAFSHVLVATGIRATPRYPEFPGFQSFPGRILHSHDFKDGKQFRCQRVLLIGARFTAEDMALHLHKYGAEHVIISHRTNPTGLVFPDIVEERPLVERVDKNTVYFVDGSSAEVDTIVLTTGFMYDFSFLEDSLRFDRNTPLSLKYPELYKITLWPNGGNNKLFYPDVFDGVYTLMIFDAQALWIWKVVLGDIALPSKDAMLADIALWVDKLKRLEPFTDLKDVTSFQSAYMDEFCAATGYERINIKMDPIMKMAMDARASHLPSYKDIVYKSTFTGREALKKAKPWMDDVDDDFEELCSTFIKYKEAGT